MFGDERASAKEMSVFCSVLELENLGGNGHPMENIFPLFFCKFGGIFFTHF